MSTRWGSTHGRLVRAAPVAAAAAAALALAGCGAHTTPGAAAPSGPATSYPPRSATPPGIAQYPGPPVDEPTGTAGLPCPASGLRAALGVPDAAMGLRAVTVSLTDCGTAPRTVSGYPRLRVLGRDGRGLDVEVHHGVTVTGGIDDPAPTTLTLRPGERAITALVWRNLVTDSTVTAVTGTAVELTVAGAPQKVPLTVDLGTTGTLDVTAWHHPDATEARQPTDPPSRP